MPVRSGGLLRAMERRVWAMEESKLAEIMAFLEARDSGEGPTASEVEARFGAAERRAPMNRGGVAVLPLYGVISQKQNMMSRYSGGTSTEAFGKAFDAMMASADVGTIVIRCDSPGGSVEGVAELADKIHAARGRKRIIAVVDSLCASAAYWLASQADEVVIPPTGRVGSIGVLTAHRDESAADAQAGVKWTFVHAGRYKVEGNPHEPLSDSARAHMQAQADEYYDLFVGAVARGRSVKPAAVKAGFGEARTLTARMALAEGLVDRIATMEQVLDELGVRGEPRTSDLAASATGEIRAEDGQVCPDCGGAMQQDDSMGYRCPDCGHAEPNEDEMEAAAAIPVAAFAAMDSGGAGGAAPPVVILPAHPAPAAKEHTVDEEQNTAAPAGAATGGAVAVGTDREAYAQRARDIGELCAMHGIQHEAAGLIASDRSVEAIGLDIARRKRENLQAMTGASVDWSAKEAKRYSLTRAIMGAVAREERAGRVDDGFEREISAHIEKNLPSDYKSHGGLFVPTYAAGLDTATSTKGQEMVFTEAGGFIDLLRARMQVLALGAQTLTDLQGNVSFTKQTGAGTWSWVSENPGSDVADTDTAYSTVALNAKSGTSSTAYSRKLLAQSSYDVDATVKSDLAMIAALGIDAAAINGPGSNAPTGILNTAGIGSVALGTNGGAPTWDAIVDLETAVAAANADIGSMGYLTTPGIRGKLKKTAELGNTAALPVWRGAEVNGYRAEVSTQVPSTLTKGTAASVCHAIIFGVWSQLVVGYWGAYELVIDPYRLKKQGMIELTSYQMAGLAVRHPGAFAAIKDALTT